MATLVPTHTAVVFDSGNRFSSTRFPVPASPFSLHFSSSVSRRKNFRRSMECSVAYKDQGNGVQASNQKPPEVPWSKELCNTVHLIGFVGNPVEINHLPSGKVVGWTRISVKRSSTETSWMNLTFWDELAHVAYQHVQKGQQIYVCGRLVSEVVEDDSGKQLTYFKVVVQQLNFVERTLSSIPSYDRDSNWASGRRAGSNGVGYTSPSEMWQAFFANPEEWWDNRKTKTNPKYPDFKHKVTGEALWIGGWNNPSWVKDQLEILDSRTESLHAQDEKMREKSLSIDEVLPY